MQQIDQCKQKYKGWYYFYPKKENDIIIYYVDDLLPLKQHTIGHEYGHGMWHRVMSDAKRADWIELYHKSVMQEANGGNSIKVVMADFANLRGRGAIKELFSEYKKDDAGGGIVIGKAIIKAIKEQHCLDRLDLDNLVAADRPLKKYLPTVGEIRKGVAQTPITPYANKNSVEHFAECFAMFYASPESRAKLPDEVYKLMEATVLSLKAGRS
jgi:hypothetical protein